MRGYVRDQSGNPRIVGVRIFFVLALILGACILAIGYYALFRVDLTDNAGGAPAPAHDLPNILLVLLVDVGAESVSGVPAFRDFAADALVAPNAYAPVVDAAASLALMLEVVEPDGSIVVLPRKMQEAGYAIVDAAAQYDPLQPAWALARAEQEESRFKVLVPALSEPYFCMVVVGPSSTPTHERVGGVMDDLTASGIADDAVVVVTGLSGHPHSEVPERAHVPFVLRYPPRLPGYVEFTSPVSLIDVVPTLADLAGLSASIAGHPTSQSLFRARLSGTERDYVVVGAPPADGAQLGRGRPLELFFFAGGGWLRRGPGGAVTGLDGAPADPAVQQRFEAVIERTRYAQGAPLQP